MKSASDEKNMAIHEMTSLCITCITCIVLVKRLKNLDNIRWNIISLMQCILWSVISGFASFVISILMGNSKISQIVKVFVVITLAAVVTENDM